MFWRGVVEEKSIILVFQVLRHTLLFLKLIYSLFPVKEKNEKEQKAYILMERKWSCLSLKEMKR